MNKEQRISFIDTTRNNEDLNSEDFTATSHSMVENFTQAKKVFFIKKLASQECCFKILSYAFSRESVETLMKMLSKEAQNYLSHNYNSISVMKSQFSYKFEIDSSLGMRNL